MSAPASPILPSNLLIGRDCFIAHHTTTGKRYLTHDLRFVATPDVKCVFKIGSREQDSGDSKSVRHGDFVTFTTPDNLTFVQWHRGDPLVLSSSVRHACDTIALHVAESTRFLPTVEEDKMKIGEVDRVNVTATEMVSLVALDKVVGANGYESVLYGLTCTSHRYGGDDVDTHHLNWLPVNEENRHDFMFYLEPADISATEIETFLRNKIVEREVEHQKALTRQYNSLQKIAYDNMQLAQTTAPSGGTSILLILLIVAVIVIIIIAVVSARRNRRLGRR